MSSFDRRIDLYQLPVMIPSLSLHHTNINLANTVITKSLSGYAHKEQDPAAHTITVNHAQQQCMVS